MLEVVENRDAHFVHRRVRHRPARPGAGNRCRYACLRCGCRDAGYRCPAVRVAAGRSRRTPYSDGIAPARSRPDGDPACFRRRCVCAACRQAMPAGDSRRAAMRQIGDYVLHAGNDRLFGGLGPQWSPTALGKAGPGTVPSVTRAAPLAPGRWMATRPTRPWSALIKAMGACCWPTAGPLL